MKREDGSIPFLGIVARNGYVEWYDYEHAKRVDFHHTFALSEKGHAYYDMDSTLRFIFYSIQHRNSDRDEISLLGDPALDPFGIGKRQVKEVASLFQKAGVDRSIPFVVENHFLGTLYEGKKIGTIGSLLRA
ncbi:hypothetical protein IMZ31_21945 (plasmid) [Pontibacillus sp. ALD_SL1]|uniref:hypothetical protein n=1 Tax=Pontibacillus sp. ALD_SL1 TaxID=2777185 RepID=UPI001A9617CE|nr:hypothetical protein [Pontibacillus sp. ALD_SL1]QST02116.1 hypothetical protein IMZ31_21945 [Pontibacillus sp. ALD_SL1]